MVDSLALETHRTRDAAQVFNALAQGNALVVDGPNRNLELAVGNLPKVKYLSIDGMNLFDVLKYDHLVMTEPTVRRLEGALGQ